MSARAAMLADYIAARLSTPFKWGEHDCVCFVAGWLELATGRDYLSAYRPWSNEREALRLIKRLGGIECQFDRHLKRIEPNFAGDGDLTLIDGTAWLFIGAQVVSVGAGGLVFRNRMEAECSWACS